MASVRTDESRLLEPAGDARGEVRALLRLGGPLVAAQLLQVSMGFVDTVMVGRLGAGPLAAVAMGSAFWILVYLGCVGMLMAVSPLTAHLVGAGRVDLIGPMFRQGLWLAAAVAVAAFAATRWVGVLMGLAGVDPSVVPMADDYLDIIAWGMPGACFYLVPRFLCEGTGHSRPVMLIQLALVPVNALGNYILIYGHFGAPAMGASGAALSSAIVLTIGALAILVYLGRARRYRSLALFGQWSGPRPREIAAMLRLSVPIALSMVMESGMFTTVAMLMGRFGEVALAAHQVAINWAALTYMVPVGLAMALTVRVGQAVGAGQHTAAAFRGRVGIAVCGTAMLASALCMVLFPEFIIGLYTRDAAVSVLAARLFLFAALFQISDGLQIAATGALRGFHDTAVPMLISAASYWAIGVPAALLIGVAAGYGPTGMWSGLVLGLTVAAVLLNLRFVRRSRAPAARG